MTHSSSRVRGFLFCAVSRKAASELARCSVQLSIQQGPLSDAIGSGRWGCESARRQNWPPSSLSDGVRAPRRGYLEQRKEV